MEDVFICPNCGKDGTINYEWFECNTCGFNGGEGGFFYEDLEEVNVWRENEGLDDLKELPEQKEEALLATFNKQK